MKKKMQIAVITIIGVFFLWLFTWQFFFPIGGFIENSQQFIIKDINISKAESKIGAGYYLIYNSAYSPKMEKHFVFLFFNQKKYNTRQRMQPAEFDSFEVIVNTKLLTESEYGTKENPIPIMNYKLNGEYVFDEQQYEYNVRQYRAFNRWISFE